MRFIGSLGVHMMGDLDKRSRSRRIASFATAFSALEADLRVVGARWRAPKQKTPCFSVSAGSVVLRERSGVASRAVIGTLRPTERRRALNPMGQY